MTSRDFCFWLQGYMELADTTKLSEKQVEMIKKHLDLVFIHEVAPSFGKQLEDLKKAHDQGVRINPQIIPNPAFPQEEQDRMPEPYKVYC